MWARCPAEHHKVLVVNLPSRSTALTCRHTETFLAHLYYTQIKPYYQLVLKILFLNFFFARNRHQSLMNEVLLQESVLFCRGQAMEPDCTASQLYIFPLLSLLYLSFYSLDFPIVGILTIKNAGQQMSSDAFFLIACFMLAVSLDTLPSITSRR